MPNQIFFKIPTASDILIFLNNIYFRFNLRVFNFEMNIHQDLSIAGNLINILELDIPYFKI